MQCNQKDFVFAHLCATENIQNLHLVHIGCVCKKKIIDNIDKSMDDEGKLLTVNQRAQSKNNDKIKNYS